MVEPSTTANSKSKARSVSQQQNPKASNPKRTQAAFFMVSESTGNLARHLIQVAVSQFSDAEFVVHEFSFCNSPKDLAQIKLAIEKEDSPLVFSALSSLQLKHSLSSWCKRNGVEHWDLVQPLLDFICHNTGCQTCPDISKIHRCDTDYFRRMDAIDFTLQHDDNRQLESIIDADIILVGVSRVGKTPLAIYLGSFGYKTANVSLVKNQPIPQVVIKNRDKAFGLTVDGERLAAIRKRRFESNRFDQALRKHQGRKVIPYHAVSQVLDEVLFAEERFRKLGINVIDMTDLTIEECAARILKLKHAKKDH